MRRRVGAMACLAACVFLGAQAGGQEAQEAEAEEHRCEQMKINTSDAGTVPVGEWEVEASLSFSRARNAWANSGGDELRGGTLREVGGGMAVTTGILPNVDFGAEIGYRNVYDATSVPREDSGFSDLGVGAKWMFYEDAVRCLASALAAGFTLPLDRSRDSRALGLTQDYVSFDSAFILTKDWSNRFTSTADVGYSLPFGEHRQDARGALGANVAAGYQVLDWLQPEIEFNYEHEFVDDAPGADVYAVTGGAILNLGEHFFLLAGVQQALAGRNVDKGASVLLTLKWCP